jgi:phage recombination protein Bet
MNEIMPASKNLITAIQFDELRLPYTSLLGDAFGIDNVRWKVLIDSIFPSAKSTEAVAMALTYCKARNLDIFKRPVHIVPMWSSILGREVETVWPGVSELRTTAFRTKQYAGCDEAAFGSTVIRKFKGRVRGKGKNAPDEDVEIEVSFPEWCQITLYRSIGGNVVKFAGNKVYWLEAFARRGKADIPNDMWCKRPFGQIEKCAEAAALRRAFPEEIGNELTAEEMEGQLVTLADAAPSIPTPPTPPSIQLAAGTGPAGNSPTPALGSEKKPAPIAEGPNRSERGEFADKNGVEIPLGALTDWERFHSALDSCPTLDALNAMFEALTRNMAKPEDLDEAQERLREVASKFGMDDEP